MILVGAYLEKVHIITQGNREAGVFDNLINLLRYHDPAVLGGTHQMVHHHRDIVALVDIETHAYQYTSTAAELRGIEP